MNFRSMGDSHNFGQRVIEADNFYIKPRSVRWEELFLSEKSKLRIYLHRTFTNKLGFSGFNLAPNLAFKNIGTFSGEVESLYISDLDKGYILSDRNIIELGSMVAIMFWFGIGDLHNENVKIGISQEKLVCFPIDIECIFENFPSVVSTLIIDKSKLNANGKNGLSKIASHLLNISNERKCRALDGFIQTIHVLNNSQQAIYRILIGDYDGYSWPIRILIRNTESYVKAIQHKNYNGFTEHEAVQMKRNDVPYFFRFLNSKKIFFYTEPGRVAEVSNSIYEMVENDLVISNIQEFKNIKKHYTAIFSANIFAKALGIFDASSKNIKDLVRAKSYEEILNGNSVWNGNFSNVV